MTAYPIIFSAPMVLALLDGRKTQTRRLAWGKPVGITSDRILEYGIDRRHHVSEPQDNDDGPEHWAYPPTPWLRRYEAWQAGERDMWLWVRETFVKCTGCYEPPGVVYRADATHAPAHRWRPSIHMPRWASRLSLRVTDMRRERLQDISEADSRAEGVLSRPQGSGHGWHWDDRVIAGPDYVLHTLPTARLAFANLWNSIHGPGAWDANPEVIALTFEVHRANIDQVAA